MADLQVAEDADGGDGEHAAQAEEVASETVVSAGGAPSQPGMVERGGDGERVEQDAAEKVRQGQVDAQHIRANHLAPVAVRDEQNQPVPQDGEQNWAKRREHRGKSLLTFGILPLK